MPGDKGKGYYGQPSPDSDQALKKSIKKMKKHVKMERRCDNELNQRNFIGKISLIKSKLLG